MRVGIIAALITLGLAVVALLIALDMHVISPTASGTVPASVSQAAQTDVAQTLVAEVAQATAAPQAKAASAAPIALPQYATASNPPAAMPLPTCSNPDGLGISRVVEIDTTGGPAF